MSNGNDRTESAHTAMMTRQARANDRVRNRLRRAHEAYEGESEDRTSSVHIHMPPSLERPNSMGAPPATVAKLEKWFPTTWRPWIRLGFLVLLGLATAFGYPVVQWLGKLAGAP